MRRTPVFASLVLALLAAPLPAEAQPAKPARIGVLQATSTPPPEFAAFQDGLRELGHIEGQTYTIERRHAGGKPERFPELAADLVRSRVDLVLAGGDAAARAVREVDASIPVVFLSGDPIAAGLVASFNRPGGNLTGFAIPFKDLAAKWAELLRDTSPRIRRVAFLVSYAQNPPPNPHLQAFQAAAAALKLDVLPIEVRGEADLEAAFAAAVRQRAEAITQSASPLFDGQRERMVALAARYRLPAIYYQRHWADAGGLMAYGPDLRVVFRRAAVYVDRILKGTRPADLPVEQPTRYELVVNLKTAKALGLTIPQTVLLRADEVIE